MLTEIVGIKGQLATARGKVAIYRQTLSNSVGLPSQCFEQHLTSYSFQELLNKKNKAGGLRPLSLTPERPRRFPSNKVHIVLCSDSIDAALAVVRSTVATALDKGRIIFHIFTTPVHVTSFRVLFQSFNDGSIIKNDDGDHDQHHVYVHQYRESWFPSHTHSLLNTKDQKFAIQKYKNPLNFLRFYLIEAFTDLKMLDVSVGKVLLLDDDLVINGDLGEVYDLPLQKGECVVTWSSIHHRCHICCVYIFLFTFSFFLFSHFDFLIFFNFYEQGTLCQQSKIVIHNHCAIILTLKNNIYHI